MQAEKFDHWAIVEVFGHNTFAGRVTEQTVGSASFVRVDVPGVGELSGFTKLLGASAIYGITIVSEDAARAKAAMLKQQPISTWDLGQMVSKAVESRMLSARSVDEKAFEDDDSPI